MRPLKSVATDFFSRVPDSNPSSRRSSKSPRRPPQPQPQYAQTELPPGSVLEDFSDLYRSARKRLSKMREIDPLIQQYVHMQEMSDSASALTMLRKIASCVKPIMRKRGWRVGTLSEFFPQQQNLLGLNVNRGETIHIRLRYAHNSRSFLPFEHALDTMLHEFCHNAIGPHNDDFHKLWNELRDEWETLTIKGYTGEGFLGQGRQLGGAHMPREEMRRRARAEAVKRDKERKAQQSQGHRLGGARPTPGTRINEVIADATIRRTTETTRAVTTGCATGSKGAEQAAHDALLNGFRTKEDMDQANAMAIQQATIELMATDEERQLDQEYHTNLVAPPVSEGLTWDPINGLQEAPTSAAPITSRPPHPVPAASRPAPPPISYGPSPPIPNPKSRPSSSRAPLVPPNKPGKKVPEINRFGKPMSRLVKESEKKQKIIKKSLQGGSSSRSNTPSLASTSSPSTTWQCEICTLINQADAIVCGACEVERPERSSVPQAHPGPPAANSHLSNLRAAGWNCDYCGNFMEHQWWTCDICGNMKNAS